MDGDGGRADGPRRLDSRLLRGTWMSYEFLRLLAEKGIPMPRQLVVSGFPAPMIDEKERPWNRNAPMDDPAFQNECRGWNVNEVVFTPGNWKTYAPMM